MFQGGTLDLGITPALKKAGGAYDRAPAPKYLVEFEHAGHLAWSDIGRSSHQQITAYSVAFMDRYVKGVPGSALLRRKTDGASLLRYGE